MERLSGEDIIHLDEFLGASHPCLHTHLLAAVFFCQIAWVTIIHDSSHQFGLRGMYANGPDMKANKGHNTDYNPQHCIVCMWVGSVPIMADLEPWMFTPKRLNAKNVALLEEKKIMSISFC